MATSALTQHQAFVVTTTAPRIAGTEPQAKRWAVLALSAIRRVIGPVELLLLSEIGQCRLMMGSEGVGGAI